MLNGTYVHVVCSFEFEIPWAQGFVSGDYEGQFTPIGDNRRQNQWAQLWDSRFM